MLLLFPSAPGAALSVSLTENIKGDDIGQGRVELFARGSIRVTDTVNATISLGTDLIASVTEQIKVRDGPPQGALTGLGTVSLLDRIEVLDGPIQVTREDFGPLPGALGPLIVGIEIGLHESSFRDTLIDEENVVAVWPLADLNGATFRDITGNGHSGTVNGTGTIFGVPNELPEGGLGMTFDGNGYLQVLDDSGAGALLNLSLANGDIDVVFMLKTTTGGATNRAIVQKMVTDATGNGWSVSLVSGAIRFRLEVAGLQVFSFDRGVVNDGAWHLVHCNYQTGVAEARIFIDGAQSGATIIGVGTEPAVTGANLRIGQWNDGSGGFIGTLAYVMIGREGDATLSTALQPLRNWTTVTPDTRSAVGMTIRYGITGSTPIDNVAETGTCSLGLDNSAANSTGLVGYYSFEHANCRAGFRKGSPLRVTFTYGGLTYVKHVGRIASALPSPGSKRERVTRVTSVDWMDIAASSRLQVKAQANIDSDDVIKLIVDEALRPPHAVDISAGIETFEYALHLGAGRRETVMSEAARVCISEAFGKFYIKGDTVRGGVLAFQSRADWQVETDILATFDNTMSGLEPNDGEKPNLVMLTVYPVDVDAAPSVIYAMTARQEIPPMTTRQFNVSYRDPNNTALDVGGLDIVTPTTPTDYTMFSNEDGSGVDLSAYASIAETGDDLGGTFAVLTVTNNSATSGWFTTQLRGRAVRHEDPVTIDVRNDAAVRREGPAEQSIDLPYIDSSEVANDVGEYVLALYDGLDVSSISFVANKNDTLMTQALAREPGDRIAIVETMQAGSTAQQYIIHHVELTVETGNIITCQWRLAPVANAGEVWILGETGFSELGDTTILGR